MADRSIDAGWVRAAAQAAAGAPLSDAEAEEQAANLRRLLDALDAVARAQGTRRRFEDEPAGFTAALLRHRAGGPGAEEGR